jgi:hypothetical protein
MSPRKFNYDSDLSIISNLSNLAAVFRLNRGIKYKLDDALPASVIKVAGRAFKSLEDALAGEMQLKDLLDRHSRQIAQDQQRYLSTQTAQLYKEFNECFPDYTSAHKQIINAEDMNEKAADNPDLILKLNEMSVEVEDWIKERADTTQLLQDMLISHFLTIRSADATTYAFGDHVKEQDVDLYSIPNAEYNELVRFFIDEIMPVKEKSDEDDAEVKSNAEQEAAKKQ